VFVLFDRPFMSGTVKPVVENTGETVESTLKHGWKAEEVV
jgi:hypothetical protein